MNHYRIRFYLEGNKVLGETSGVISSNDLVINDSFIISEMKKVIVHTNVDINDIKHWNIILGCENINLIVKDYTLCDTIYLESFHNIKSSISLLKTSDVGLHIVDFSIKLIQSNNGSVLTANCEIEKFDFDIENHFVGISNSDTSVENNSLSNKLEIRSSEIKEISIYSPLNNLIIQGSVIQLLSLVSFKEMLKVDMVMIWQASKIQIFRLKAHIKVFKIEEAEISKLYPYGDTVINEYIESNADIERIFNLEEHLFSKKDLKVWKLFQRSLNKNDNEELYFHSLYMIKKHQGKNKNQLVDWIFRKSIGYGYKPDRTIRFILSTIAVFAAGYFLCDSFDYFF